MGPGWELGELMKFMGLSLPLLTRLLLRKTAFWKYNDFTPFLKIVGRIKEKEKERIRAGEKKRVRMKDIYQNNNNK